jgi:hypothetical protein
MLIPEENALLTRTVPGTPGGDFMRRYWHPVALSEELPPDAAPLPRRILGEDLVLFRDDAGRVGPIHDRSREHLGTSDVCIINARRLLLDAIRSVARGEEPPHIVRSAAENDMSDIAGASAILPAEVDYRTGWREAVKGLAPA